MELFLLATEPKERRNLQQKAAIFLHVAGQEAIEVFNMFGLSAEEAHNYDVLVWRFEAYCLPRSNETFERYVFRTRRQEEGDAFEHFYRDIQLKAVTCGFGDLKASMLRDQIAYGTTSKKIREKLLRKKDLTLEIAVKGCKAEETANIEAAAKVEIVKTAKQQQRDKWRCRFCNQAHAPTGDLPPRLQRLFLRLLKFEFDLQFVLGKKLVIADTLSRISGNSQAEDDTTDVEIHANAVFSTLVGSRTLGSLQAVTASDPVLQEAIDPFQKSDGERRQGGQAATPQSKFNIRGLPAWLAQLPYGSAGRRSLSIGAFDEPSYSVVTEDGMKFRHNRQHLLKVDEEYDSRTTEENDDSESENDGRPESPGPDCTDEETEGQEAPQAQRQQGP
ncbi:hypothetical protein HPB47_018082 [Ixodes persulcatus]|uniref:Uncharacterized protein n=1 Tax=Ixodes persulcatus TaxID=34615 RepID=A0AC60QNM1_IXOPE|nr:hypothetical protein HPB47_018082 [Ixodes persulcatus]